MLFDNLVAFKPIIKNLKIKVDKIDSGLSHRRLEITFINNTILHCNEVVLAEDLYYKYSFQWQNPDNSLIVRWDNAEHSVHKHISTYPHHKHIQSDENVHPSEETTLVEVLTYILEHIEN